MGFEKSRSPVKALFVTGTVLQQSVEKSPALGSENSKLRQPVLVHSQRLHEVIADLKVRSKVDCELWIERVVEEEAQLEKVELAGGVDVEPLVIVEEVAVVAERKIVVRLSVAVVESVVGADVAEDVVMVEVEGKGKEVVVIAEEAEERVCSRVEDWILVKRKVMESEEDRRRRMLEEERDVLQKRMNVWRRGQAVVPNAPLGPGGMSC
ncbi:hypothetical protein HOY80DRAFT_997624 [Tuber brumale]|nr:hypothetical protein HOY80DRAFT_997624 [Tuber brumale]